MISDFMDNSHLHAMIREITEIHDMHDTQSHDIRDHGMQVRAMISRMIHEQVSWYAKP